MVAAGTAGSPERPSARSVEVPGGSCWFRVRLRRSGGPAGHTRRTVSGREERLAHSWRKCDTRTEERVGIRMRREASAIRFWSLFGCKGFRNWGVGFRVYGFRVYGFRVYGFRVYGFRVYGFRVYRFRVYGFRVYGFRVPGHLLKA